MFDYWRTRWNSLGVGGQLGFFVEFCFLNLLATLKSEDEMGLHFSFFGDVQWAIFFGKWEMGIHSDQ